MNAPVAALNLQAEEEKIRVYADINASSYLRLKLRCAQVGIEKQRAISRKEYLEWLIEQDCAKVAGASVRVIEHSMDGKKRIPTRRKDQK